MTDNLLYLMNQMTFSGMDNRLSIPLLPGTLNTESFGCRKSISQSAVVYSLIHIA